MGKYNSGKMYNKRLPDGGLVYNSGPFSIKVSDTGTGTDEIENINTNILISDNGISNENINLLSNIEIQDLSNLTQDIISVKSNVNIADSGLFSDVLSSIVNNVTILDFINYKEYSSIAEAFFVIDSNNMLQPLGVVVTNESKIDFLPFVKENTDEIPGKHGEYYFGKEFKSRIIELHVVTKDGMSEIEKLQLQRQFAKYLNPMNGPKSLIFSDDIKKTYLVKYAGKISFSEYASWFPFVIPFRMSTPYIMGSFENKLTGNGTALNEGNAETPIKIIIDGPVSNPSIQIGSYILSYDGTLNSGESVTIDTLSCTAKLNGNNVLDKVNGKLPYYLPVGSSNVISSSQITILWTSRWI